jgi:hypothetical protein
MPDMIPIKKLDGLRSDLVRPTEQATRKLLGIFDCGVLKWQEANRHLSNQT